MPLITPERQLEIAIESLDRRRADPFRDKVAALHAEGLMDTEIARRLDVEEQVARRARRSLHLPSNASGGQRVVASG